MAFRNRARQAINFEDIDGLINESPLPDEALTIDAIEAQEDEVAVVEATAELDKDLEADAEGEELADVADEEVAAGEEIIAEADAKAAETGEEPVIPVEEVVASQEALKTLIKLSGEEYTGTFANAEDVHNNSYTVYKQNLEGLKEIGSKIKEGLKAVWAKIVSAFNWIVDQIKKILPSKIKKANALKEQLSKAKVDEKEAGKLFASKYGEKLAAWHRITNLGKAMMPAVAALKAELDAVMTAINLPSLNTAESAETQGANIGRTIDEVRAKVTPMMEKFNASVLALMPADIKASIEKTKKDLDAKEGEYIAGLISGFKITGRAIVVNFIVMKKDGFGTDSFSIDIPALTESTVSVTVNDTIAELVGFIGLNSAIKELSDRANAASKKILDILKDVKVGFVKRLVISKIAKSVVTGVINVVNNYNNGIYTHAVAEATCLLKTAKKGE